VDSDGFFFIVDRAKDLVIRGGYNVYPREIEEVLYEHPAVREAAVVGVPNAVWGEAVVCVVSLKPSTGATPEDLRAHTRERLAGYTVPKAFHLATDLPKSAAGKILRSECRLIALGREEER